ncbi:MAG: response regulator transcription factor [Chloroflexi bacterium]|nr:response regulator transcription factor [Chloroflexota bacterium]
MQSTRVVLLSSHSLLTSGVQRLLEQVDGVQLSIVAADNPDWADKVQQSAPHVIVLDSDGPSGGDGVITRVLRQNPSAKVITLDLARKGIDVYRMQRLLQTNLEGLLEVIRGKTSTSSRGRRHERGEGEWKEVQA